MNLPAKDGDMPTGRNKNLALFVIIILCTLTLLCCARKPNPTVNESDLLGYLIPLELMPPGWQVGFPAGGYIDSYYSEVDVKVVFLPVNGPKGTRTATGHSIHVFLDSKNAAFKFRREFAVKAINSGEFIPDDWIHPDLSANEDVFSCEWLAFQMNSEKYLRCEWIARYGNYVVVFGTWILPEIMSFADIQKIIVKIDQDLAGEFK